MISQDSGSVVAVFSECTDVDGREPIRQGDVFESTEPTVDPWQRFGLIVTADCDLALDKHAGILSYVPILDLADYLRLFYFPRRVAAEVERLMRQLVDLIRGLQAESRPEFAEPVSDEVIDQMSRRPPDDVADALQASGAQREKLIAGISTLQRCARALESRDHDESIAAYVAARTALGVAEDKAWGSLMTTIQDHVRNLPGDGLFLSSLSAEHKDGYVAYLRLIRETTDEAIALRQSELGLASVSARRISRLRSPYVFHLTQRLSSVFAAIGLPTEYEDSRALVVEGQYAPGS